MAKINSTSALLTMGYCAGRHTDEGVESSWVYQEMPWWDMPGRLAYRMGWEKAQRDRRQA